MTGNRGRMDGLCRVMSAGKGISADKSIGRYSALPGLDRAG